MSAREGAPEVATLDTEGSKPDDRALGEVGVSGVASAAITTQTFSKGNFGDLPLEGLFEAMMSLSEQAQKGDLTALRTMLAGQAVTLNAVFSEMARRAAVNMGGSLPATEAYMRLALKAQAQSRSTVETLDRIANGREQTVKHVHVNEGGQAVVTEHFHHHSEGGSLGNDAKQPHAKRPCGASLPSADSAGNALQITSDQGKSPLPNARRKGKRTTKR